MKKVKTGAKIFIFIIVAAVLFAGVSYIVQPYFDEWGDPYAGYEFYDEPENTIETLFLGSSVTETAAIPMQLYEDYGICSYNAGTQGQPLMASYYWAQEVYRFHEESLDTVVLDLSTMHSTESDGMYIKVFDNMKLSKIKLHFIKDYSKNFTEFISHLFPILFYHENWKTLSSKEFQKANLINSDVVKYTRGYCITLDRFLDTAKDYTEISLPFYTIQNDATEEFEKESIEYLTRLIEFCEDKGIQLVLIKTPQDTWSDEAHNTAQEIADEYQLDFLDFNYLPLVEEIDYNGATDSREGRHLNYYGAVNFTDWIGRYLIENCGNRDVRGDENYAFMEEELEDFHREIVSTTLADITDPAEYLSGLMSKEDYAIFISVKDDACDSLTEEQRDVFESLGLTELAQLPSHASYLAVIDDGKVVTEQMQAQDQEFIDSISMDEAGDQTLYIKESGRLPGKIDYYIESGGYKMGNVSSIQINGKEYSPNKRGLNIVVYDKKLKTVVDEARFDTFASPERENLSNEENLEKAIKNDGVGALSGELLQLYLYDRLCDDTKTAKVLRRETGEDNLTAYLQEFWDNGEFSIFMSGDGDISDALTDPERQILADMGLTDLSGVEKGDSYLAVVQEGEITIKQRGNNEERLQVDGEFYKLCSGGTDEESGCSLIVQGTEYASETEGLNIVIYDNVLDQVVDTTLYDTDGKFVSVSD